MSIPKTSNPGQGPAETGDATDTGALSWPLAKADRKYLWLCLLLLYALPFWWWRIHELQGDFFFLLLVMAAITSIPFLVIAIRGRGSLINPITLFSTFFFINYAKSSVEQMDAYFAGIDLGQYMQECLGWATLGLGVFTVGYYLPFGRLLAGCAKGFKLPRNEYFLKRFLLVALALMILYYVAIFAGFATSVRFIGGFDVIALALVVLLALGPNPPERGIGAHKWHAYALLALLLIPGLISGLRGTFVTPVLVFICSFYFAKKHFPWKTFVGFVVLAFLFIIPILGHYKHARLSQSLGIEDSLRFTVEQVQSNNFYDYTREYSEKAIERFGAMPVFVVVVAKTGYNVDYLNGETYRNFFVSFIPRVIWKDKPVLNGFSNWLAREYGMLGRDDRATSVGFSLMGEAWMNFGRYGMITIMFLYGIFYRAIFEWLLHDTGFTIIGTAAFIAIIQTLCMLENVFINNVTSILKIMIVILAVVQVAKLTGGRQRGT